MLLIIEPENESPGQYLVCPESGLVSKFLSGSDRDQFVARGAKPPFKMTKDGWGELKSELDKVRTHTQ